MELHAEAAAYCGGEMALNKINLTGIIGDVNSSGIIQWADTEAVASRTIEMALGTYTDNDGFSLKIPETDFSGRSYPQNPLCYSYLYYGRAGLPAAEVVSEVETLVRSGRKEIILLGQNVNSYCAQDAPDFPALLEKVNAIGGDFWIRFLTSHPKDMTERLIETGARLPKCTNYIHLALQSGDDTILEKMNRKYTAAHFLTLVEMIRKHIPDVMLTTDIIVGFPGETEEQFRRTAELMEKARFDIAYINKYSPRAGTVSARLADDVSWEEKKRREKILNAVLRKTALENNRRYVGRTVEVLVEKTEDGHLFGKTRSFKDIKLESDDAKLLGQFVKAEITAVTPWALEGKPITDNG
jgi:tRNA-2-methylthio-N6-dimethylallyladenosine synthase